MSLLSIIQRPKYKTVAVNFDGTNDYGTRGAGLDGAANADNITVVFTVDFTGNDDLAGFILSAALGEVSITRTAVDGYIQIATEPLRINFISTTQYSSSVGWKTILFSRTGTTLNLYEADTDIKGTVTTNASGDIDFTATDWFVGARNDGLGKLTANFADFWFSNVYFDFSQQANRRKFVDAQGKPVWTGLDGSVPNGTAPLIFFRRGIGESADSFLTNKGTGGGFTVNGALSDSTNGNPTG